MERILAQALGQDVTQLADQEKRLLLSRLLARFAHEVRNPLSSLAVHVQLLEEDIAQGPGSLREKTEGRFEIIRGELHRLENVVKQFLSLAGPSALNLQRVDPAAMARQVCELLEAEGAGRGIEIIPQLAEDLPLITADPVQLTQALINVLINAIQAIEKNGRIEVAARVEADQGRLLIEISDTGPGIPPEKSSTIFEPFFTTKPEGSGLGLWIVQQIIAAHGGTVMATNMAERGARFVLRLPLNEPEERHG